MSSGRYKIQGPLQGITYLDAGPSSNGTTLVCIPGWACNCQDYAYLFDELSKLDVSVRAVSVNLPGQGTSSQEPYTTGTVSEMASATLSLLEGLDVKDVVLVGHSMGYRVITQIWRTLQGSTTLINVRGMVFLDGSHYNLRVVLFAFDSDDARSKNLTKEDKLNGMTYAFQRMFSSNTPSTFQASTLHNLRTMDLDYSEKVRKGFIDYDRHEVDSALEQLGKSGTPLLSFQATDVDDENQRIPLKTGASSKWTRFLQEKVPQAQQVVVEDSMHFPHVDQPAFVAEKVRDFLKDLRVL